MLNLYINETRSDMNRPHDPEAEMAVIGAMVIDNECIELVKSLIDPEMFYDERNKTIYKAVLYLKEQGKAVDIVSLSDILKKYKRLDLLGGGRHLCNIIDSVVTAGNVETYISIVKDKATQRGVIDGVKEIETECQSGLDVEIIKDKLKKVSEIVSGTQEQNKTVKVNADFMYKHQDIIDERKKKYQCGAELPTGIANLDSITWGLSRRYVWVIGGRPGMGKTTLCTNIALNLIKKGSKVLYISTESTPNVLIDKMLACDTRINLFNLKIGRLTEEERSRLIDGMGRMAGKQLYIQDKTRPNITEIEDAANELKPDLMIIDYIDRIDLPKAESQALRVAEAMHRIADIAQKCNCAIIVATQLNRSIEKRGDSTPVLSDAKDGSAKEEDAHTFIILSPTEHQQDDDNIMRQGITGITLWLLKNKDGETGAIELDFHKQIGKFVSAEPVLLGGK